MRAAHRALQHAVVHGPPAASSVQHPSAACNLLAGSSDWLVLQGQPPGAPHAPSMGEVRRHSAVADAQPKEEHAEQQGDSSVLARVRGILARQLPPEDVRDMSKAESMMVLRFGDLPATAQLMESFVPEAPSPSPIYDIPSWLASTQPGYDLRPRSPFYNWVAWMGQNLPKDQARLYLALDAHMLREDQRQAIMRKLQFELARLWDWQHRRVAQGLPLTPSAEEEQAGRAAAVAAWAQATSTTSTAAAEARARLKQLTSKMGELDGWRRNAATAEAAVVQLQAVLAEAQLHLQHDTTGSTALATLQKINERALASMARVDRLEELIVGFERLESFNAAVAAAKETGVTNMHKLAVHGGLRHEKPTAGFNIADVKDRAAGYAALLARMQQRVVATQAVVSTAMQVAESVGLSPDGPGTRFPSQLASNPPPTPTANSGAVKGLSNTGLKGVAGSGSERRGTVSAASKAVVPGSTGSTDSSTSGANRPPVAKGGLLGFMRAKEQKIAQEAESRDREWNKLALTPPQRALLVSLTTSSDAKVPYQLQQLSDSFSKRVKPLGPGPPPRFDRSGELLQKEWSQRQSASDERAAAGFLKDDQGSTSLSTNNSMAELYSSTKGKRSGADARRLSLAAVLAVQAEKRMAEPSGGETSTWSQWLPVLGMGGTGGTAEKQNTAVRLLARARLDDQQLLKLDAGAPFSLDPLHQHPYHFHLGLKPPTYTLDLVTDYMQVKYQDVIVRRDAVHRMEAAISETSETSAWEGRLSPHEVHEVNTQADLLFQARDVQGYEKLMARMADAGLIDAGELAQHSLAIQRRAGELAADAAASLYPAQGADLTVLPEQRAGLAALLAGLPGMGGSTPMGATETVAKAAWQKAGLNMDSGSPWAAALTEQLMTQLAAQRSAGGQISASAESELRVLAATGKANNWDSATATWDSYLAAAGASPQAPKLWEVVAADEALRAARANTRPSGAAALAQAQLKADHLNQRLQELQATYAANNGSPVNPVAADLGPTAPLDVRRPAKLMAAFQGSLSVGELLRSHWEAVSRTYLQPTLGWGIAPPWEQLWSLMRTVYEKHYTGNVPPPAGASAQGGGGPAVGSTPAQWLVKDPTQAQSPKSSSTTRSTGSTSSSTGSKSSTSTSSNSSDPTGIKTAKSDASHGKSEDRDLVMLGILGPDTVAAAERTAEEARQRAEKQAAVEQQLLQERAVKGAQHRRWTAYCKQQALTATTQREDSWQTGRECAPPYPGARQILRFSQCIMLSPAASLSSAQGLAARIAVKREASPLAAAVSGLRPPPVLMADHPAASRVVLRVHVGELCEEVGLSAEGLQHLLRVAGLRRYEEVTGDLVLLGNRYPAREENRRWCLERLHMLLEEAHSHEQLLQAAGKQPFSGSVPPFLLTRPGVASLLGAQP